MKFRSILPVFVTSMFFGVIFFVQVPNSLAATFTINSTLDTSDALPGDAVCDDGSGICTLRAAIEETNALGGLDDMHFNIGGGGVQTILPNTPYPSVIESINIDGMTQPGYINKPLIQIVGVNILSNTSGLVFDTAGNNTIKGLSVNSFTEYGIVLRNNVSNTIIKNFLGTDSNGLASFPNLHGGIALDNSSFNTIDSNLISGNLNSNLGSPGGVGIHISDSNNIFIQSNYIGVNVSGNGMLANSNGIVLENSDHVFIGGSAPYRNIISGNFYSGVALNNSSFNNAKGNYIGTDVTGTLSIPNNTGIELFNFSGHNNIGTNQALNLISGNLGMGISIFSDSNDNLIQGNRIGTDVTGTIALSNGLSGINIETNSLRNTIGGANTGEGNLISGNSNVGVMIVNHSDSSIIKGNRIGTDITGTLAIPNISSGIFINDSLNTIIGGANLGEGNLISGNATSNLNIGEGININYFAQNTKVLGNKIGTDVSGTSPLSNKAGILVFSDSNIIGGPNPGEGNLISGNNIEGIGMSSSSTNIVQGNKIGTDITGTNPLMNQIGISLLFSQGNLIGGTNSGAGNLISGNDSMGVSLNTSHHNTIQGNFISTDINGTTALPNFLRGISINDSSDNLIGGNNPGEGNLISGTTNYGVVIDNNSMRNMLKGNKIGIDITGTIAIPNVDGVTIGGFSTDNVLGGSNVGDKNLISGNIGKGISILSDHNIVQGNFVGTDINGTIAIPNKQLGVHVWGSHNNVIGGGMPGEGNLISGNGDPVFGGKGIALDWNAEDTKIMGNKVGTDVTGTVALPNIGHGIEVGPDAIHNQIGGGGSGEGNLISGNKDGSSYLGEGIYFDWLGHDNKVLGNKIGTDITGTVALPNMSNGIFLNLDADNNLIGGSNIGEENLISGNIKNAIWLTGAENTIIEKNKIGTDINGNIALPNLQNGIHFNNSGIQNIIRNNLVSGNKGTGIFFENNSSNNQIFGNKIGTNLAGTASLQNQAGIGIVSSNNNQIGSANPLESNLISGNLVHGIFLKASTTNQIKGNKIGTDINGNTAIGNGNTGIFVVDSDTNQIGGATAGEGNLISGSGKSGIQLGFGSDSNQVQGNKIGTNTAGLASIFNKENGILINENSTFNQIGGVTAAARNLISGNQQDGINIAKADTNVVKNNWVGVDSTGLVQLSNGFAGIRIQDGSSNVIGGGNVNEGNTIAFNKEAGVTVIQRTGTAIKNQIRFNSIFNNAKLGIDLGNNAVTVNDNKDPDTGANMLQNYPTVLTAQRIGPNSLQLTGSFNTNPTTTLQVDVYASPTADTSGFGEGKRYLGTTTMTTNAQGNVVPNFNINFAVPIQIGEYISMTATDPNGNTSEFSNAKVVN